MMSRYLDPAYEILNEQEIIAPKGVICRPDRLMIKGRSAVVLDYKTGKPDPAHDEQVRNYARLLKDMGYTVEGAFLAYIREEPVIAAVELASA
jgi:hypothetical protein